MDSDGLPLVGPGIDYTKVGAINQKRTLAFLNHFITHTVRFMNRFSCVCEEKLEALAVKLQRLETSMNILEAKLSSIPGLENVTSSAPTVTNTQQQQPQSAPSQQPAETPEPQESDTAKEKIVEEPPKQTVAQDPRYAKYFKMVQVGVPPAALKPKMLAEGLDPDLLENPNAPAPAGGEKNADASDSESDFSEEEEKHKESDSDSSSGFSD